MGSSTQQLLDSPPVSGLKVHRAEFLVAVSPFLNATVGFLTAVLLANLLSLELFGAYLNWVYAATILAMVASFGLPAANAYAAAKSLELLAHIRGYSLAATWTAGAVGAAVLCVYVANAGVRVPFWATLFLALTVPGMAALASLNGILLGSRENRRYLVFTGLPVWVQFVLLACVWAASAPPAQAFALALGAYAAGCAAALGWLLWAGYRVARPQFRLFRQAMRYALPLWVHSIFSVLVQRFDILLLTPMLTPVEIGVFALASKLADVLAYAPQGLSLALFSSFAQSGTESAYRSLGAAIRLYLVFGGLGGVAAWAGCAYVLPLFVSKAAAAVPLLPPLLAASALMGPLYLLCSFCQALGRSRAVLAITAGAFCIKLAFLLPMAAVGGLAAAPPAVLMGAFFALQAALAVTARVARRPLLELITPSRWDWRLAKAVLTPAWRTPL
jgi:O-antigen/teichoic acid export membrane protein